MDKKTFQETTAGEAKMGNEALTKSIEESKARIKELEKTLMVNNCSIVVMDIHIEVSKEYLLDRISKNPELLFSQKSSPNKFLVSISERKPEEGKEKFEICDYDLDSLERAYFRVLLKQENGNKAEVARRAKVKRGKLIGKLERLGIPIDYGRK